MKDRSVLFVTTLLLLITLLALGLRLYRLDAQSLWYDEGFSIYLARMDPAEITARTAADIQPPLYYYLLHGWIETMADDEIGLRSLSVLFGVLTVPLIYAVARQLFRSRLAGLLAALFVAVSPLHVWYGQEARMYTLLTFLCLLSSYLLLLIVARSRRAKSQSRGGARTDWVILPLWLAYTLANIAAIYTHYFAFFVLAFQALYLVLVWGLDFLEFSSSTEEPGAEQTSRPIGLLLGGVASGLGTILAYLPWLPHVFTRYGQDVSYWPGQLKLHEVLIDIALLFVGGESISEPIGILLSLGYGLVFAICLAVLVLQASSRAQSPISQSRRPGIPGTNLPIAFLLLYLLLPPLLILLLSYNTPKFNARYVMVAHPAFLLTLAGGLAGLWQRRGSSLGNVLRGAVAVLSLLFVLGVPVYANYNAYTDPAFARADFRGVARYINRHIEPDEAIILVSGHMFPVFDYYAPDAERYLLPDSPTLDTTRTLDFSVANDLGDWLADRNGVWVVLWQDEVVDPAGYLTTILSQAGEEQSINRTFSQVELKHYRLPEDAFFSEAPDIHHPADFNFGNRLRLLGYTQTDDRQVTLFWKALRPLDQDYRVSIVLRDTTGQNWGQWDGRPTAYYYPTDRWQEGQVVFGRHDLTLMPGAAPGDYGLEVGVYTEEDPIGLDVLDPAGAPQGKRAMLGAVQLSVAAITPEEIDVPNPVQVDVGGGVTLLGWDLDRFEAQPGDRMPLTLFWSVTSVPRGDYWVRLLVTDASGQMWDVGAYPPTNIWHPTSIWLPGQAWRGQTTFRVPIQSPPGEAQLSVQLVDASGAVLGSAAKLGAIEVLPTSRTFDPPQPQSPRQSNFDDKVVLVGADLEPNPVAPGGVLHATLYWQAQTEMDIPYTVFVHLLGAEGQMVAGHDGEPVAGTRPTTSWVPGEYVADLHEVSIPLDLPPGQYVVEVGFYDAGVPSMPRLPILSKEGHRRGSGTPQVETDRVIFGPVQVR